MTLVQFIVVFAVAVVALASFTCYRSCDKIYCRFTRKDKTEIHKWIKAKKGDRVEFDNGWYTVITDCITLRKIASGVNMLFPMQVRCLNFSYKSTLPDDPKTGEPYIITAEMRKALEISDDVGALNKGSQSVYGKPSKIGGLFGGGLMPIILVVGIVAIGYFVFQLSGKVDALGLSYNTVQEMLMQLKEAVQNLR